MKHGKKPTLSQKKRIKELGFKPENWLVVKDTTNEFHIVNRSSGRLRKFRKENEIYVKA